MQVLIFYIFRLPSWLCKYWHWLRVVENWGCLVIGLELSCTAEETWLSLNMKLYFKPWLTQQSCEAELWSVILISRPCSILRRKASCAVIQYSWSIAGIIIVKISAVKILMYRQELLGGSTTLFWHKREEREYGVEWSYNLYFCLEWPNVRAKIP